jgi:hypothetical protein
VALAAVAQALDRVRSPALHLILSRSNALQRIVKSRAFRVEFLAVASVLTLLAATLSAPIALYMWGPLLLGIPHLIADVRYLLLEPYSPIHRRVRDGIVVAILAASLWWTSPVVGCAAVLAALVLGPSPVEKQHAGIGRAFTFRAIWIAVAALAYAWVWQHPINTAYILLHGHNVVAIVLFSLVFGRGRARWLVPFIMTAFSLLIISGACDSLLPVARLQDIAGYLLPNQLLQTWQPQTCARIAVLFVFLQGAHYTIWLRLIPEQTRQREGMRSFGASLRALQSDFGKWIIAAVALSMIALVVLGLHDAANARTWYLRAANFHAYLELAFFARWLTR